MHKQAKERAERDRAEARLLDKERQKRTQQERAAAELKQQMFTVLRTEEDLPRHQARPHSPWRPLQPRQQQQLPDPPTSPQLQQPVESQLQSPLQQYASPQLQQQSPLPQQQSPQLQPPASLQPAAPHAHVSLQHSGLQLHQAASLLQESASPQQQPSMAQQAPPVHQEFAQLQQHATLQENGWSWTESGLAQATGLDSSAFVSHWGQSAAPTADRPLPHLYQTPYSMAQDHTAWNGRPWPMVSPCNAPLILLSISIF